MPVDYVSTAHGFTMHCDSKAEARYAAQLDLRVKAGEVAWWLPHVRFPLPAGEVYECDFLVVETPHPGNEGSQEVAVIDVKGVLTAASKAKIAFVKAIYGIDVEIVKVGGSRK